MLHKTVGFRFTSLLSDIQSMLNYQTTLICWMMLMFTLIWSIMKLPVSALSTVLCRALYTKGLRPSPTMIGQFRVIELTVTCSDLLGSKSGR